MPRFGNLSAEELEQIKRFIEETDIDRSMTRCARLSRRIGSNHVLTHFCLLGLKGRGAAR